jgi:hypothetical protein
MQKHSAALQANTLIFTVPVQEFSQNFPQHVLTVSYFARAHSSKMVDFYSIQVGFTNTAYVHFTAALPNKIIP